MSTRLSWTRPSGSLQPSLPKQQQEPSEPSRTPVGSLAESRAQAGGLLQRLKELEARVASHAQLEEELKSVNLALMDRLAAFHSTNEANVRQAEEELRRMHASLLASQQDQARAEAEAEEARGRWEESQGALRAERLARRREGAEIARLQQLSDESARGELNRQHACRLSHLARAAQQRKYLMLLRTRTWRQASIRRQLSQRALLSREGIAWSPRGLARRVLAAWKRHRRCSLLSLRFLRRQARAWASLCLRRLHLWMRAARLSRRSLSSARHAGQAFVFAAIHSHSLALRRQRLGEAALRRRVGRALLCWVLRGWRGGVESEAQRGEALLLVAESAMPKVKRGGAMARWRSTAARLATIEAVLITVWRKSSAFRLMVAMRRLRSFWRGRAIALHLGKEWRVHRRKQAFEGWLRFQSFAVRTRRLRALALGSTLHVRCPRVLWLWRSASARLSRAGKKRSRARAHRARQLLDRHWASWMSAVMEGRDVRGKKSQLALRAVNEAFTQWVIHIRELALNRGRWVRAVKAGTSVGWRRGVQALKGVAAALLTSQLAALASRRYRQRTRIALQVAPQTHSVRWNNVSLQLRTCPCAGGHSANGLVSHLVQLPPTSSPEWINRYSPQFDNLLVSSLIQGTPPPARLANAAADRTTELALNRGSSLERAQPSHTLAWAADMQSLQAVLAEHRTQAEDAARALSATESRLDEMEAKLQGASEAQRDAETLRDQARVHCVSLQEDLDKARLARTVDSQQYEKQLSELQAALSERDQLLEKSQVSQTPPYRRVRLHAKPPQLGDPLFALACSLFHCPRRNCGTQLVEYGSTVRWWSSAISLVFALAVKVVEIPLGGAIISSFIGVRDSCAALTHTSSELHQTAADRGSKLRSAYEVATSLRSMLQHKESELKSARAKERRLIESNKKADADASKCRERLHLAEQAGPSDEKLKALGELQTARATVDQHEAKVQALHLTLKETNTALQDVRSPNRPFFATIPSEQDVIIPLTRELHSALSEAHVELDVLRERTGWPAGSARAGDGVADPATNALMDPTTTRSGLNAADAMAQIRGLQAASPFPPYPFHAIQQLHPAPQSLRVGEGTTSAAIRTKPESRGSKRHKPAQRLNIDRSDSSESGSATSARRSPSSERSASLPSTAHNPAPSKVGSTQQAEARSIRRGELHAAGARAAAKAALPRRAARGAEDAPSISDASSSGAGFMADSDSLCQVSCALGTATFSPLLARTCMCVTISVIASSTFLIARASRGSVWRPCAPNWASLPALLLLRKRASSANHRPAVLSLIVQSAQTTRSAAWARHIPLQAMAAR
ncbi:MAG: hypothetical protein SGPRY_004087 [Prymnesium sp.]